MQNNGTLSGTKPTPSSTRVWVRFYTVLVVFTERGKRGENAFESKNMFSQIAPFPSLRGALSSSAGAASSGKGAHTPEWRAHVFGLCCGVIEISHSSRLKMYTNRMVFLVSIEQLCIVKISLLLRFSRRLKTHSIFTPMERAAPCLEWVFCLECKGCRAGGGLALCGK